MLSASPQTVNQTRLVIQKADQVVSPQNANQIPETILISPAHDPYTWLKTTHKAKMSEWKRVTYINSMTGYYPGEGEYWGSRGNRMHYGECAINGLPFGAEVLVWHPKLGYFHSVVKDRIARRYSHRIDLYVTNRRTAQLLTQKGQVKVWWKVSDE
jgi:hypothetical protein